MYRNDLIDLLIGNDAERRRRRDEAWRAWHRRPDAAPLPEEPRPDRTSRWPGFAIGVSSIASPLANRIQPSRR